MDTKKEGFIMKTQAIILVLLLLTSLNLSLSAASVDEQISAIVNAAPEDRVTLVNEFKETLSTMNDDDRATAIAQMQSTMSADTLQTKTQTGTKERVNQTLQSEDMQRVQQMNQTHTGSQAMQQGQIGSTQSGQVTPNKFMGNK